MFLPFKILYNAEYVQKGNLRLVTINIRGSVAFALIFDKAVQVIISKRFPALITVSQQ